MRQRGTDRQIGTEAAALVDLLRDIRDELRYLRQEIREAARRPTAPSQPERDELLTVGQVAEELQVIPDTVRTWIQSGALRASRPGRGDEPGRKYRVRRADLKAFVEAMRCRAAPAEGGNRSASHQTGDRRDEKSRAEAPLWRRSP
jgi:excisionase family DNA binding protein